MKKSQEENMERKYDVALSFSGEDRERVGKIAEMLMKKGIKTFYDKSEEVELFGKELLSHFTEIYKDDTRYVVMFLSESYNKSEWAQHEFQSAKLQQLGNYTNGYKEYILPIILDESKPPKSLKTIGHIDAKNKSNEEIVSIIEKKVFKTKKNEISLDNDFHKKNLGKSTITVSVCHDERFIAGANVVCFSENGTHTSRKTEGPGIVSFTIPNNRKYVILAAHRDFPSYISEYIHINGDTDHKIFLKKPDGTGSIIIDRTGHIPMLEGRLESIKDTNNRTYIYAKNISINNGEQQPYNFEINKPIYMEDSDGKRTKVKIKFIDHDISVIEYTKIQVEGRLIFSNA